MSFNQELLGESVAKLTRPEQENVLALFASIEDYKEEVKEIKRLTEAEKILYGIVTKQNLEMQALLHEVSALLEIAGENDVADKIRARLESYAGTHA